MLKIGDFARISRVPVKTLRYYDEIGLLRPAGVDHYTRYRYYTPEQLEPLKTILGLKGLGFSLEEIRALLRCRLSPGELQAGLLQRRGSILAEMHTLQEQLQQVDARLAEAARESPAMSPGRAGWIEQDEEERTMKATIVEYGPFKVVGMRYLGRNQKGEISQLWRTINQRWREIQHADTDAHVAYGVCRPNPQGLIDYLGGFPVLALEDIPAGMEGMQVPRQTYVVMSCPDLQSIVQTYEAILKGWLPGSEYEPGVGPDFELYPPSWDPEQDPHLEIYFPVKPRAV